MDYGKVSGDFGLLALEHVRMLQKDLSLILTVEYRSDLVYRYAQLAKRLDASGSSELHGVVHAVSRPLVDAGGRKKPFLFVETQGLHRQHGQLGKLADLQHAECLLSYYGAYCQALP